MAFCKKCGVYLADGTRVCPSCGTAVPGAGGASAASGAAAAQAEAPREEARDKREPWERDAEKGKEPWEQKEDARDRNSRRTETRREGRGTGRSGAWNPGQAQSQSQGWTGPGAWRYTGREDARGYTPPYMDPQDLDARENRGIAALSYFGILFFLPLVLRPKSPFCRFHANQGLLLLLVWVASQVCFSVGFFGWIAGLVLGIGGLAGFFCGVAAALRGQWKELPIVGSFRLIK